ncbi:MAG: acyltransferase [Rhodoglobus sp.]
MIDRFEFSPWDFWAAADADSIQQQKDLQTALVTRGSDHALGDECFVSALASVETERFRLGDRSYVAAGAYLTGSLEVGADCSINPYAVVRGRVAMGDGVRVGAHTSILGFNHTMDDPELPVFRQPLVSRGITLGDDVWVGSHVVVLDGVSVGDHAVLAAGAIVTKDVPEGAIVAGNPAKFLRWRKPPTGAAVGSEPTGLTERLDRFAQRARDQVGDILDRSWSPERELFLDHPGAAGTVRAQGDAIELADLLLGHAPPQLPAADQIARLRGWQDPTTGGVAPLASNGTAVGPVDPADADVAYHVLSVGYALDLLGSSFEHPLRVVTDSSAAELATFLDELPWRDRAWHAGHWVDALGTAVYWSKRRGDSLPAGYTDGLIGWLVAHADSDSGMWGRPTSTEGLLQMVNGMYRTTRGTFAQFGLPLPYPERVIDTVLRHSRDLRYFEPDSQDACNVLDVAHPLWLTRGSGYRTAEVTDLAERLLGHALDRWTDGAGFAFSAAPPDARNLATTRPGLQGTEMWLATMWYLADICGVSAALGYRPRGVHRPEAAPNS